MNVQQLRSVRQTVRQGFKLTHVAEAPHTSQPGVSRQLNEPEDGLGIATEALADCTALVRLPCYR